MLARPDEVIMSGKDAFLLINYQKIDWLRIPWC